jgi:hypothetical protein
MTKRKQSKYKNWFTIKKYGNGENPLRNWNYKSWEGFNELPELKQNKEGLTKEIREYIFHSVKR